MLHSLQALFVPALAERLTLLLNHVLAAEPVATERLVPHAGRSLSLSLLGWPRLLPQPPVLAWRITPAGLLEWVGADGSIVEPAPDLALQLEASNPALLMAGLLAGEPPPLQIDGDAQLAGDVNWLIENLRWDVTADLERLFGPMVAQQLAQVGGALGKAVRTTFKGLTSLAGRLRPRGS